MSLMPEQRLQMLKVPPATPVPALSPANSAKTKRYLRHFAERVGRAAGGARARRGPDLRNQYEEALGTFWQQLRARRPFAHAAVAHPLSAFAAVLVRKKLCYASARNSRPDDQEGLGRGLFVRF